MTTQAARTITGTVDAGDAGNTVTLTDNGTLVARALVAGDGTWTAGLMLASGVNTLQASVTDLAGNTGTSAPVTYALGEAPTIALTTTNRLVDRATQVITGVVEARDAGATIAIYAAGVATALGTALAGSDGTFAVQVALPSEGDNLIYAAVQTAYGTAVSGTADIALVTRAPYTNTQPTTVEGYTFVGSATVTNRSAIQQTADTQIGGGDGLPATFVNQSAYSIAGDYQLNVGTNADSELQNTGTIVKSAGSGLGRIEVAITNDGSALGVVEAASGSLELAGDVSGRMSMKADAGATLILDKAAAAGTAFTFAGAGATLQLNDAPHFQGTISGFGAGESIDLRSIGQISAVIYFGNGSTGSLFVTDGSSSASLNLTGTYNPSNFVGKADGHGGTLISYA